MKKCKNGLFKMIKNVKECFVNQNKTLKMTKNVKVVKNLTKYDIFRHFYQKLAKIDENCQKLPKNGKNWQKMPKIDKK